MKRIIGLMLALVMLIPMSFSTSYAADTGKMTSAVTVKEFDILGVEYYQGMEVIENKTQLEYELNVDAIVFDGNSVELKGEILYKGTLITTVDDVGTIYKSTAEKLVKVNGITAIFAPKNNMEIVSCSFEENADSGELFPVNEKLNGKTVLKLAVKIDNKVLYFEGEIPIGDKYSKIFNLAIDSSNEREIMSEMKGVSRDIGISEKEVIQLAEHWKYSLLSSVEEVSMAEIVSQKVQTRATTPVPGVPVSVFTTEGTYKAGYISTSLGIGYYAVTYAVGGTNNYVTNIIKWEYLRNPSGNISSTVNSGTDGTVGFNILDIAEYTYYAVRDSIECTNTFIPYRIKNATVEMGLRSKQEILTRIDRTMQANGSSLTVNWSSLIGLLPFGEVYTTTAAIFNAIEYRNHAVTSQALTFHNNAQDQMDSYDKLVRGYKLTSNGKYFAKIGDKLEFDFRVVQPNDLSRTAGTYYIGNQYYFEIYERNSVTMLYTKLAYTVNQQRTSSYKVFE